MRRVVEEEGVMVNWEAEEVGQHRSFSGRNRGMYFGSWEEVGVAAEAKVILWRSIPMAETEERRPTFRRRWVEVGPLVPMGEGFLEEGKRVLEERVDMEGTRQTLADRLGEREEV
jgi:hypothetical protein